MLKTVLINAPVLGFYNPTADTKIIVDASPQGLGVIFTQKKQDGTYKPTGYGLRALTDTESRYSQTEHEALPGI